jgi:hypothetical protein
MAKASLTPAQKSASLAAKQFAATLKKLDKKIASIPRSPQVLSILSDLEANQPPANGGFLTS